MLHKQKVFTGLVSKSTTTINTYFPLERDTKYSEMSTIYKRKYTNKFDTHQVVRDDLNCVNYSGRVHDLWMPFSLGKKKALRTNIKDKNLSCP